MVFADICRHVAGHKIRLLDQIRGLDGLISKSQVGNGYATRFLRVVVKISLYIFIGVISDDLDGVFIGTHRSVGTHAPELTTGCPFRRRVRAFGALQRKICHIIHDADGKFFLRLIVIYRQQIGRIGVFGTKAISPAIDWYILESAVFQRRYHIQIQRLSLSAWLFAAV